MGWEPFTRGMKSEWSQIGRFLLLTLLACSLCVACDGRPAGPVAPLAVTLQPVRKQLLPFEPLFLATTVKNPNTAGQVSIREVGATVQYRPAKGGAWRDIPTWWTILPLLGYVQLPPQSSLGMVLKLFTFNRQQQPLFQASQRYEVRLKLQQSGVVYSNTVTIACVDDPAERAAMAALSSVSHTARVDPLMDLLPELKSSKNLAESLRGIESYVKRFPQSTYAIYMRWTYCRLAAQFASDPAINPSLAQRYETYLMQHAPWVWRVT